MNQLEIELELCKQSFKFFMGYCFWHMYHTNFIFYKFHDEIIKILLNIKPGDRIIINAPPRIGKTELLKHFIAWQFLKNPSSSVLYISYDETLVLRKNREIKDLLTWISKHFGITDLKMLRQANGKKEWVNRAQGTIIAKGSNNAITGSGCKTMLVVDDPNKPSDRSSPNILETRNTVFKSTIRNRIDTPLVPIFVIQQRVGTNDLSGFLLSKDSGENWKHYNFPAINADGTALCPERLPLSEIETYKSDPFTYNAQYMQVPLDDIGNLFNKSQLILKTEHPPLRSMQLVISIDAAMKSKVENDYNAIALIGRCGPNFYILDVANFHADITELIRKVKEFRNRWGKQIPILFESKANGIAAVQILRATESGILEVNPKGDKVERALLVKYLFDSLNVYFSIRGLIWGDIQTQFTQFPHCLHDDIVDAVVQGIDWLNNLPGQRVKSTKSDDRALQRPIFGRAQRNINHVSQRYSSKRSF